MWLLNVVWKVEPVLIDTGMKAVSVRWAPGGQVLALAGTQEKGDSTIHLVQFYSPTGQFLRMLKIPGSGIKGLSWEGNGLRLAMAVDSYIFFAHLRLDYKWASVKDNIVFGFTTVERPGEHCVTLWNFKSGEKNIKYVREGVGCTVIPSYCCVFFG